MNAKEFVESALFFLSDPCGMNQKPKDTTSSKKADTKTSPSSASPWERQYLSYDDGQKTFSWKKNAKWDGTRMEKTCLRVLEKFYKAPSRKDR
jgi:hypothetical protein